jgi:hypothetical protein
MGDLQVRLGYQILLLEPVAAHSRVDSPIFQGKFYLNMNQTLYQVKNCLVITGFIIFSDISFQRNIPKSAFLDETNFVYFWCTLFRRSVSESEPGVPLKEQIQYIRRLEKRRWKCRPVTSIQGCFGVKEQHLTFFHILYNLNRILATAFMPIGEVWVLEYSRATSVIFQGSLRDTENQTLSIK